METTLLIILIVLFLITIVIVLFRNKNTGNTSLEKNISSLQSSVAKIETGLKDDFRINREENAGIAKDNRSELNTSVNNLKAELMITLNTINEQSQRSLQNINQTLEDKVAALILKTDFNNKSNREELAKNMTDFSTSFNNLQRDKFAQLDVKQNELIKNTEAKLESIRVTVEEKLEKTLSERLGQSFETVGKQLIEVQKGLGEMQTLAQDVGGLKRVLSNVKMRGGFGEVQLHMMLESILAPEQFEANVITKQGSSERVEYAVKFPNKEGERDYVWLPIDAKFPKDAYENLQAAYDTGELQQIEHAQKLLETVIKKMAGDICNKYIDAPNTTNFGIMFLPFEGLFAEVVRKASLLEQIQRECNVIITGPTTLAVILNSLQMGFRTLAIQKRSSEVWLILSAVKKEFSQFGGMLDKAQKNIQTGLNQLDDVVGVRTRAIQRQLKGVETIIETDEKTEISEVTE
ncbi:MAG: DNA recombination protein RmuC [Ferruginibacter sp.]